MKKTIFVIGANGVVGTILCKKLIEKGFDLQLGLKPSEGESVFQRNFKSPDLIVNLAYDLSEKDIKFLENFEGPVLDTTSRYRTDKNWIYGLHNLPGYSTKIEGAARVSNPGCFSQGGILLLYPLIEEAILDCHSFVSMLAIGGYSSAGKPAYSLKEQNNYHSHIHSLLKPHPHKTEIHTHANFKGVLDFTPVSAEFERGTFVKIAIPGQIALEQELYYIYNKHYSNSDICIKKIQPKIALDGYNGIEGATLYLGEVEQDCCVNVAIHFDNLLKGAASTAVKNICAMLRIKD